MPKNSFLASFKESKHLELPNITNIYAGISCFGRVNLCGGIYNYLIIQIYMFKASKLVSTSQI